MSHPKVPPASGQPAANANSGDSAKAAEPVISTHSEHVICQRKLAEDFARIFGGEL